MRIFLQLRARRFLAAVVAVGGLAAFGCRSGERIRIRETAEAVRDLTGSHTRVVWVEDHGDNRNYNARSDIRKLRLMGYDSRDGLGARVILGELSNYAKPMITPRGDRVVFSDFHHQVVSVVDFDGANRRRFTDGMALGVWRDPETGIEWVYVGRERVDRRGFPYRYVYRHRLDDPDAYERAWDRRMTGMDNFQLSADGRYASGLFPWPDAGVADLRNGTWTRLGRGCWPSLAPDHSHLFWVFRGDHRTLRFHDLRNDRSWSVPANTAPGIDGRYRVYHPRWSNHPRFMAVTGPYRIRVGGSYTRGGGPDVEVHIGRFNEEFTEIEAWVRLTDSERAAFFPDVWIASAAASDAFAKAEDPAVEEAEAPTGRWPVTRDDLVFIWEDRSRDNETTADADGDTVTCSVRAEGLARYGRFFEMDVRHGRFVAEDAHPRLRDRFRERPEFTFEALITPTAAEPGAEALIAGMSAGPGNRNYALLQRDGHLYLELRLSPDNDASTREGAASLGESGDNHEEPYVAVSWALFPLKENEPTHVIVSYGPGRLSAWRNGTRAVQRDVAHGDFRYWDAYPLAFGGDAEDQAGWAGFIEGVTLYNRAIEPEEAVAKYERYAERLAGRSPPEQIVVEARLAHAMQVPTLEAIAPYRRALIANEYELVDVNRGQVDAERILVAHWVILNDRVLDTATRVPGRVYRMTLEPFEDRPELEGEWIDQESDDFFLPLFFDVDS